MASVGDSASSQQRKSRTSESSADGTDLSLVNRQRRGDLLAPTARIGATVLVDESTRRHRDEPCQRVVGKPCPPFLGGHDESLLHGVLGVRELAGTTSDRAEGLRGELAQQVLDVGSGHTSGSGAPSTWRTSIGWRMGTPPGPGAADDRAAISRARSRLSTSTSR